MSKFKLHVKKDSRYLDVKEIVMDINGDVKTIKTDMGIYQIKGNEHLYGLFLRKKAAKYIELDLK